MLYIFLRDKIKKDKVPLPVQAVFWKWVIFFVYMLFFW
jgi:hypothetical protein